MGMVVMSKRELNRLDVLARLDGARSGTTWTTTKMVSS